MTDHDGPGPEDSDAPPAPDTSAIRPMRARPVLPRALDTRAIPTAATAASAPNADEAGDAGQAEDAGLAEDAAGQLPPADASPSSETAPEVLDSAEGPAVTHAASAEPALADESVPPESVPADPVPADPVSADPVSADPVPADPESAESAPADPVPASDAAPEPTPAAPIAPADDSAEASSLESPAPIDVPARGRRRARGTGAIAVGARAAAGTVGVLLAGIVVAAATVVPAPLASFEPLRTQVTPVTAAQQRVCPGPLLRLGDEQGQQASTATSVGTVESRFQAEPGEADAASLEQTENTAGVGPEVLTLPPGPEETGTTAVAGSQSEAIDSGDLVGLAVAECAEPSGDTWLVGGSTDVGRTTLITLSNPTSVIATVDLAIFGTDGEVVAPGTNGIVVSPGSQRVFSLAAFAPQLVSPVVQVTSRGGLVVANLQQSTVRTLEPGGVELVGASRSPARQLAIAGLQITGADEITDRQAEPGAADLQTALRVFVPGEEATTAQVTITPARGNTGPTAGDSVTVEGARPGVTPGSVTVELELPARQVTELPITGLSNGEYALTFDAEAPIVAGARVSTSTAEGQTDFAWLSAGFPLNDVALVSIAPGPDPQLTLLNPSAEPRDVVLSLDGEESTIGLEPGEAVPTTVAGGSDLRLSGASGLIAAVSYTAAGSISVFGVSPPGPASGDLTVYR